MFFINMFMKSDKIRMCRKIYADISCKDNLMHIWHIIGLEFLPWKLVKERCYIWTLVALTDHSELLVLFSEKLSIIEMTFLCSEILFNLILIDWNVELFELMLICSKSRLKIYLKILMPIEIFELLWIFSIVHNFW